MVVVFSTNLEFPICIFVLIVLSYFFISRVILGDKDNNVLCDFFSIWVV